MQRHGLGSCATSPAPRPMPGNACGCVARNFAPDRQIAQAGIELTRLRQSSGRCRDRARWGGGAGLCRPDPHQLRPDPASAGSDPAGWGGFRGAHARTSFLARALDRKDAASVARLGGGLAPTLTELLLAAGPADRALQALEQRQLPAAGRSLAQRLAKWSPGRSASAHRTCGVANRSIRSNSAASALARRAFRSRSVIAQAGRHEELGRGGRHVCGGERAGDRPDALLRTRCCVPRLRAMPASVSMCRSAPMKTKRHALRGLGYATDHGAGARGMTRQREARRLDCSHIPAQRHRGATDRKLEPCPMSR